MMYDGRWGGEGGGRGGRGGRGEGGGEKGERGGTSVESSIEGLDISWEQDGSPTNKHRLRGVPDDSMMVQVQNVTKQ